MNTYLKLSSLVASVALTACVTAPPNLIARGMNVTWDANRHTVESFVTNERRTGGAPAAAGAFMVYIDPDENPVSPNHRPQDRNNVDGLAASATTTSTSDFSPLAHAQNAHLANVRSITLRADPKTMVAESDETDNVLTTPLPAAVGATIIHGPSLVPLGMLDLGAGRFVGQKFTAPATATLLGIEITAVRCSPPSSVPLRLEIKHAGTLIGTASIAPDGFQASCVAYPPSISGTAPGVGYFDLSPAPVAIASGESYTFDLYNDMSSGSFRVGMTPDLIEGNATDYGANVVSIDLTYKLFLLD